MKHVPPFRPRLTGKICATSHRCRRACAIILITLAFASFQYADGFAQQYTFDGRVTGTVQADGLHLAVSFVWPGDTFWYAAPYGVDVYRWSSGDCGVGWQLITAQPVPWSWQDADLSVPFFQFEIVDGTAEAGHAYAYKARAVDVARNPIPDDYDAFIGTATYGIALLGHGTLIAGPGGCGESWVQNIQDCPGQCYGGFRFTASPEVAPYINSGIEVLVYGVIQSVMWTCQTSEEIAYLSIATPSTCTSAVQSSTWGYVKSLYR